jgi:hypothetical protein
LDILRLFLLLGSAGCACAWLRLRRRKPNDESGWRSRLTAEISAGRSASSAILSERGADARSSLHAACRGMPLEPPRGDETSALLLRAAIIARSASLRKTGEAVSSVKPVLDSFDANEARLNELTDTASFRGLVLSLVLCFLVPFFVEMLPLLSVLQSGSFLIPAADPVLRYLGAALALVSSHFLSNRLPGSSVSRPFGRMSAFMAVLFVSSSMASSLPVLGRV